MDPSLESKPNDHSAGDRKGSSDMSGLETLTMAAAAIDHKPQSTTLKKEPDSSTATQSNEIPILPSLTADNNSSVPRQSPPQFQADPGNLSSVSGNNFSGPMSIASLTNPTDHHSNDSSKGLSGSPNGSGSARRKKQCPQCMGWFSNLATHKSIHLADNSRPHTCQVCGRGFARPNDLFRHQKSHRGDAPFRCPLFVKPSINSRPDPSSGNLEPACHQTGGFSRCDTYKNHLKAMHFEYPAGTKKRDRNGMSGRCKGCGLSFQSTEDWITEHIEKHECEGIKRIDSTTYGNNNI